jgi:glutamate N-acetyltransferase/amino-acid N-acetyltransferase
MFEIQGIKIATGNCGLKYKNRDDLLLIKFDEGTAVAGVFTKSSTSAAPVNWCRDIVKNGVAGALIVNAGNANAFTGQEGDAAVKLVVSNVADLVGCDVSDVYMSSTGVIGERLKHELITAALPKFVSNFASDEKAWERAAKAIMTTDTFEKHVEKTAKIGNVEVKINGFAKGSGMIAPNMATMLGYIFTDANIDAKVLQEILSDLNEETFNAITVDSDQSTNDTVLLFATKKAKHKLITDINDPELSNFKIALKDLMLDLAKKIVIDGEGATKLIEIAVLGAQSKIAAKNIALSIANSPLVKTAIAGSDPNWGRIIMAVGKSGEKVDPLKLGIKIGDSVIAENGERNLNYVEKVAHQYLLGKEVRIEVDINLVSGDQKQLNSATVWTCDFTEGYIKINKDYRS